MNYGKNLFFLSESTARDKCHLLKKDGIKFTRSACETFI